MIVRAFYRIVIFKVFYAYYIFKRKEVTANMFELKNVELNSSGMYFVKRGQTLKKISEFFSVPEHIIIFRNKLFSELKEGDVLFLPTKREKEYKVSAADTLSSLMKKYSFSKEDFIKTNGIDYVWVNMIAWLPCNK